MKPSPYQITAFTHAARERSFSRAAAVLGVTQSSVTQHVAKLEKIMGTQLFVRRREGLELTRAARELYEISDRLRTLEQLIEEKIDDLGKLASGYLRIISNAARPTVQAIAIYAEQYPQVNIDFSLVSWDDAKEQLESREADIAVILSPPKTDGLYIQEIGITRYNAYLHKDHPLATRQSISLAELVQETVVVPEDGSLTQKVLRRKVKEFSLPLPRLVKTSSFALVKETVLHGVGIGLMLEGGQFTSRSLISIPIMDMTEDYPICLVTPADKKDLRLVRSFCDVILDLSYRSFNRSA